MNRTDRLYALVEELRAVSPRPRSASWLATRFEVSVRTIERDLDALRESGVPIRGATGRTGGYALDRDRTLPPLALTPDEALAISIALRSAEGSPFAAAARSAALKVRAGLPADVRRSEVTLASYVHRVGHDEPPRPGDDLLQAVAGRRVTRLQYLDGAGAESVRDVEPMGLLWGPLGWYLMAWCRLRDAVRGFHLDRIASYTITDEVAPERPGALDEELARLQTQPVHE